MIRRHRSSLTKSVSKMLIESLVLSRMKYAISVWGPCSSAKRANTALTVNAEQGS